MPRIQKLSATVITQIAAGEVIERPASVVKELVENSLDAGATRVDVELEAGGTELIRVVDNGYGMDGEDLPLSIAPHATSKLRNADDLFRIGTLGFRGEALASICGVAKVKIQSRPVDQDSGNEISCEGGERSEVKPWGGAVGTRIEVKHLFYNIPARKKFLKTVATELRNTSEIITRLALAHPTASFALKHNNRTVIDIPSVATLPDRIELFFGREIRRALLEVDTDLNSQYRISGYVCNPATDRGNAQLQYLFINGRWFRDRSIGYAFQDAYRGLLMTGRYAIGFLYLDLPPDSVDVNVHPTKSEVRFRDSGAVYSLVRGAVKERLLKENLIPSASIPQGIPTDTPRREQSERTIAPWETQAQPTSPVVQDPTLPFKFPAPQNITPSFKLPEPEPYRQAGFSNQNKTADQLGQVSRNVPPASLPSASSASSQTAPPSQSGSSQSGVSQSGASQSGVSQSVSDSKSVVNNAANDWVSTNTISNTDTVSQHVPHQPIHEAVTKQEIPTVSQTQIQAQTGLPQTVFQLHDSYLVMETNEGMMVIDQHALHERILFEQLRTKIRENKLEIQKLLIPEPIELPPVHAAAVIEAKDDLMKLGLEVSDFGGNTILLSSYPKLLDRKKPRDILMAVVDQLVSNDQPPSKDELLHLLLATMACKAAVKAGDSLSQQEIQHLLLLRDLAEDSHHCPHGRPTSLLFSRSELDKQFKRT
jgi:DNA mismatch repair protein MutL